LVVQSVFIGVSSFIFVIVCARINYKKEAPFFNYVCEKCGLDIFKEATGADDAAISDLRVIKKRLNHRKGMIGLSVKTSSINTFGDIETAAMQTIINQKGKTPSDLERCLKAVELLQNQMNELLRPKFTK
jgi:hypothetical protein